jgi:hypothetical protein
MEEENQRSAASHWQTLSYIVVSNSIISFCTVGFTKYWVKFHSLKVGTDIKHSFVFSLYTTSQCGIFWFPFTTSFIIERVSKYDRNHPKSTGISDLILGILQNDQLTSSRKVEDTKGIIRSRKIKGQIIQRPKDR